MIECPLPANDTGIGVHDDANVYWQPWGQWDELSHELYNHGIRWYLLFVADENKAIFARALINAGIMPIVRLWPAKMPHLGIDPAHVDAYLEAGVKWFVIGNEFNLNEEWEGPRPENGPELCARQYHRYAQEIRAKGGWPLTPPPSLGGHVLHRVWFRRFMQELHSISNGKIFEALYPGGIGLHCRSAGNPLEDGPEDYDCSAREWEWFDKVVNEFVGQSLPMANLEAFDEPGWHRRLNPELTPQQKWEWWYSRNKEQMQWFNPDYSGYKYPLEVICNTFWLIHDGGTWADCGLKRNYFYGIETGDSEVPRLYRDMPSFITWTRRETNGEPPNGGNGEEPPTEVKWINVDDSMREYLKVVPYTGDATTYWQIDEVEYYPEWDSTTCFGQLLRDGVLVGGQTKVIWPDGEEIKDVQTDPLRPDGLASDHPMWRSMAESAYTIFAQMPEPSEGLYGIGLAAPGEPWRTLHRPLRVRFKLVVKDTEPPPPVPGYTLVERLKQAPHGFEDMRKDIEKISDMETLRKEAKQDEQGNPLFHLTELIVLHHSGNADPHTPMDLAEWATQDKVPPDPTIPYHFCIDNEGKVSFTARLIWTTYHTHDMNDRAISVCLLGDYTDTGPSSKALEAARFVVAALYEFFGQGWGQFRLVGLTPHRYVVGNVTRCPGKVWPSVLWSGPWPKLDEN